MKIPETPDEIREAIDKLDWDVCDVRLEVIEKTYFGLLRKDFVTKERWVAQFYVRYCDPESTPRLYPIIGKRAFTVDTRLGEDYNEKMTQAFEALMGLLFEEGWELSEDTHPYTRPIYLRRPPRSSS